MEATTLTRYTLYLESGPRQRKTMVHVLDLLGCIAQGPTTKQALENTSDAIRAYLRFLHRHGEAVKLSGQFTTSVAAHIMEGNWLGYGDPPSGFAPDFQPLCTGDLNLYLKRLTWLHADLLKSIRNLPRKRLIAKPATGRSIRGILDHVAGSECVYLRYQVGRVEGLSDAMRAVESSPDDLPSALKHLWQISGARLKALSATERKQSVQHGQVTWTARRAFRRLLEHDWEHLQELSERLNQIA